MGEQVGDIHSTERGSGARYNQNKPALDLIPLNILAEFYKMDLPEVKKEDYYMLMFHALGDFQLRQRGVESLWDMLRITGDEWEACARVFDYGKRKYAAWNWSKGMPWSVPIGCIARHLRAMRLGEFVDPESGLPHIGHVFCNIVMLLVYTCSYPEGDDRPPAEHFQKTITDPNIYRTTQEANV